jgi:RNA polymerase sigma-70 factor (ECF subfamily)
MWSTLMPKRREQSQQRSNLDKQALFEEVAIVHLSGLYYAALRLTGNPVDAEDLLQETYARAYGAFESFTFGTNARAWLYRIMNNTFLNNVTRSEARLTRAFSALSPRELAGASGAASGDEGSHGGSPHNSMSADPAEVLIGRTLDSRLTAALALLTTEMRSSLVIVDVGGFSYDEAAHILGCPVGTVRSRLHRARSILRNLLTESASEINSDVGTEAGADVGADMGPQI